MYNLSMGNYIDKKVIDQAQPIGRRGKSFGIVIGVFMLIWAAAAGLCAWLLVSDGNNLMVLLIVAAGVLFLKSAYEMFLFLKTPKECVKAGEGVIYFWSRERWNVLAFPEIDEVRTNLGMASSFTTMRSMMDKGALRIFDTKSVLYRIKYLEDPLEVKDEIERLKTPSSEQKIDNTINTTITDNTTK